MPDVIQVSSRADTVTLSFQVLIRIACHMRTSNLLMQLSAFIELFWYISLLLAYLLTIVVHLQEPDTSLLNNSREFIYRPDV